MPQPTPLFPLTMAALSCLTPLASRHGGTCLGFLRAAALRPSSAAGAARFSVATSNSECGLRSSLFRSWRLRGDKEQFSGLGVGREQRRTIVIKAADQGAIELPLMSSMRAKVRIVPSLVFDLSMFAFSEVGVGLAIFLRLYYGESESKNFGAVLRMLCVLKPK